ncbi:MAG: MATE family efflux transporter [Pseudomonadota bacterium]
MADKGRFTRGSTLRHVAVMTATSTVGLISLFLVDVLNLFYISLLGEEELAAAIGFAGTFQFFLISVSIGLAIASGATVSRAIGAGDRDAARERAGTALAVLVAALTLVTIFALLFRGEVLALLGATGRTAELASRFLGIVLPGTPLLGIAMVTSGLLRAAGDARRAMIVTLSGGALAAVLDPIFIFALGLGLDGTAIVSLLTRCFIAGIGIVYVVRHHDLLGRPSRKPAQAIADVKALAAIAGPAVATQLSTPFGLAFLTSVVAAYGDEAVAGWAVIGRLGTMAFGGIYAMSGAVGPIIGQNAGAEMPDRIRSTYANALMLASGYVLVVWAILWLLTDHIVAGFGLSELGAEVVRAFTTWGAGAFMFTGWLFVSNAACNNLGRPLWATGFNWSRDAILIPLLAALLGAAALGPATAVAIQAAAAVIVGTGAAFATRRFLAEAAPTATAEDTGMPILPAAVPFASGRALAAVPADGTSDGTGAGRGDDIGDKNDAIRPAAGLAKAEPRR